MFNFQISFLHRIHPRDKQDVAHRLALSSIGVAYRKSVEFQGPFPVHLVLEDWTYGAKINVIYSTPVEERDFEGFEVDFTAYLRCLDMQVD